MHSFLKLACSLKLSVLLPEDVQVPRNALYFITITCVISSLSSSNPSDGEFEVHIMISFQNNPLWLRKI